MKRRRSEHGLSRWNVTAGGPGAAPGKNSHTVWVGGTEYRISPYTTQQGRHAGYLLSVSPGWKHNRTGIEASGREVIIGSPKSSFRSPQAAAKAAGIHMAGIRQQSN